MDYLPQKVKKVKKKLPKKLFLPIYLLPEILTKGCVIMVKLGALNALVNGIKQCAYRFDFFILEQDRLNKTSYKILRLVLFVVGARS